MSFPVGTLPRRSPLIMLVLALLFAAMYQTQKWANVHAQGFVTQHCTTSMLALTLALVAFIITVAYAATPEAARGSFGQWLRNPTTRRSIPLATMAFAVLGGLIAALVVAAVPSAAVKPSPYINVAAAR